MTKVQISLVLAYVGGFLTRAAIAMISDLTYDWRQERAWRRTMRGMPMAEGEEIERMRLMKWRVKIWGIEWDDGKGEYDVSDLPRDVECIVDLEAGLGEDVVIEHALGDVCDNYGSLIAGTHSIEAKPMRRRGD